MKYLSIECFCFQMPATSARKCCGNECENVSHVLWECSAYSSTRASFIKKLQDLLEDDYEDFESAYMVQDFAD